MVTFQMDFSKVGFVFGVDISRDNIENRIKSACARYLNYRNNSRDTYALFVTIIRVNIRDEALFTEKESK